MNDYTVILSRRTSTHGDWVEVHREQATAQTLADFRSGVLLQRVDRRDQVVVVCMVRLQLIAPDGAEVDAYNGPHPDDGPELFRQTAAASRGSIANYWAALINGADPGPVPPSFGGDLVGRGPLVEEENPTLHDIRQVEASPQENGGPR